MQIQSPTFKQLFDQLGLSSRDQDIARFIQSHRPLAPETRLSDAPFWTEAQSRFLCEALNADADWALPIDRLNHSLRADIVLESESDTEHVPAIHPR